MRKSWQVFHDRSLLVRSFWSLVLPVLEYCSAANSHLKLLDRVVRSAGLLAGGVLECNLAHRRSVAELCMLFKIRNNPMHPLSGALPLPYVPARVIRGALVTHRHSFAPPHCRTSQYRRIFVPLSVSLWNDLSDPVFDGVGLVGLKSRANAFLWHDLLSFLSPTVLTFSSFHGLVVWGWGLWTDSVLTLSLPCTADSKIIIIKHILKFSNWVLVRVSINSYN